ncbi:MAG: ABC transporter permease [Thermoanaerobaculia bacterium]|nr:ABC transporter permease [Thermoanaerobaculia bacterium]
MKLPGWSRWCLRLAVPSDRHDDVVGDLEEVHAARRQAAGNRTFGRLRAWLATSAETMVLVAAFLLYRFREAGWEMPHATTADLRFGLRLVRKQPILAGTVVLAMTVGIAIATTGFTVHLATAHAELPFPNGDRFVRIFARQEPSGWPATLDENAVRALRSARSFAHLGVTDRVEVNLLHEDGAVENLVAAWITPDSFASLPYVPVLGRLFDASDGAMEGTAPAALLRESLWRRSFDSREEILGQTLDVSGLDVTVVGVLPDSAGFPTGGELWLALSGPPRRGLSYFAILQEDSSVREAQQELTVLGTALRTDEVEAFRFQVEDYTAPSLEERTFSILFMTGLILLLVVIASNAANLIYARSTARQSELAIRTALGAARSRIIGQIGVEVALLALLAAGMGLFLSQTALRWMEPLLTEVPFWLDLGLSPGLIVFVLALALLSSIVAGIVPALRATRRDSTGNLRAGGQVGGFRYGHVGSTLMVVEMALSIVMLTGAVAIARGLTGPADEPVPWPEDRILVANVRTPYHLTTPTERGRLDRIVSSIESIDGVLAAAAGSFLPGAKAPRTRIRVESPDSPAATHSDSSHTVITQEVGPGFFETLEAQALEGRLFRPHDFAPDAPRVAVVTQSFADRVLAGGQPLGRRFRPAHRNPEAPPPKEVEIVGVVPSLGLGGFDAETPPGVYVTYAEEPRHFYLMATTDRAPARLAAHLRRAVADVDPTLQLSNVVSLVDTDRASRDLVHGFARSLLATGTVVLLLSAMGLYALVSFRMILRGREIGLRVALGAQRRNIVALVVRDAARPVLLGGLLGTVVVWVAARFEWLDKMFALTLSPAEPWVLPVIVGLLAAAGIAACWAPTWRALSTHPSEVLKSD